MNMNIYIFSILVVVIVTVVLNLILFVTYRKAINQSKRQVERSKLFLDASRLKNQLHDLEKEGNFQKTPLMNSLVKNYINMFTTPLGNGLGMVKFIEKKPHEQEELIKELSNGNDVELEFWRSFNSLLKRLHKTNQPLSHFIFNRFSFNLNKLDCNRLGMHMDFGYIYDAVIIEVKI